jgi:hypothetical protein
MNDKGGLLANVLLHHDLIDYAAIEDAENYDGGLTLTRVIAANEELGLTKLRAEIVQLKALLAYAAPSVDHLTCLEPPYSSDQCKRCEIEKILESK